MSLDLEYTPAAVDLAQLADELLRASLTPESVRSEVVVVPDAPPAGPPDLQTYQNILTVYLSFPDGTVEADVDAVVAAHVPKTRYDAATVLAERETTLRTNRRRADYARLLVQYKAAVGDPVLLQAAAEQSVKVLQARDRDAGLET